MTLCPGSTGSMGHEAQDARTFASWGEVADLWRTTEDLLDIRQNGDVNSYPMGVGNVTGGTPLAAGTCRIRGTGSGRCMDVDNSSTAAG